MSSSRTIGDLGLTEKGSGGCGCCTPSPWGAAGSTLPEEESLTTTFAVSGMTCGHCASTVTKQLSAIDGVQSVNVQLNAGAVSSVTVASDSPLDLNIVRSTLDEAGYALVGS